MSLRKYVVGNWKMHGLSADIEEIRAIAEGAKAFPQVDVALCLPTTLIHRAVETVSDFAIGAQDLHFLPRGAQTGCVGAEMLVDAGAALTIVYVALLVMRSEWAIVAGALACTSKLEFAFVVIACALVQRKHASTA